MPTYKWHIILKIDQRRWHATCPISGVISTHVDGCRNRDDDSLPVRLECGGRPFASLVGRTVILYDIEDETNIIACEAVIERLELDGRPRSYRARPVARSWHQGPSAVVSVAKMEAADWSVTVDLMMRSLLAIGATPGEIA